MLYEINDMNRGDDEYEEKNPRTVTIAHSEMVLLTEAEYDELDFPEMKAVILERYAQMLRGMTITLEEYLIYLEQKENDA